MINKKKKKKKYTSPGYAELAPYSDPGRGFLVPFDLE